MSVLDAPVGEWLARFFGKGNGYRLGQLPGPDLVVWLENAEHPERPVFLLPLMDGGRVSCYALARKPNSRCVEVRRSSELLQGMAERFRATSPPETAGGRARRVREFRIGPGHH
jgi:hypothetical protein